MKMHIHIVYTTFQNKNNTPFHIIWNGYEIIYILSHTETSCEKMKSFLHSLFQYAGKRDKLRASLPAQTVIRGRSADNRKALLNSRCPLSEWKFCIGFPRADKLADSRILCRMRAEQAVSVRNGHKYQSAGRERTGTCRTVISSGAPKSPTTMLPRSNGLTA